MLAFLGVIVREEGSFVSKYDLLILTLHAPLGKLFCSKCNENANK
jgi:hypothetical protein